MALTGQQRDQPVGVAHPAIAGRRHLGEQEHVPQPRRVIQEMSDGHAILRVRPLRHVSPHLVIQRQLALLREQQDAHRRELFGDRGDVKHGCRRDRDGVFQIRHAEAASVDDGAAAADGGATSRRGLTVPAREHRIRAGVRRRRDALGQRGRRRTRRDRRRSTPVSRLTACVIIIWIREGSAEV